MPSDWLSYSLAIGDRPLGAKEIDFQIQSNDNPRFVEVSVHFFKMIFCPTGWFILKQLDNLPSLFTSDVHRQLGLVV